MRGNAWLIEPSKFAKRPLLIVWKCAELRLPIAWKCAELRPANAWKCAEMRLAWECELRGCLRTATRVRGTRVGSAREVRLKCGSSAWNCGSMHWWVPYLYGTGTLRVNGLVKHQTIILLWRHNGHDGASNHQPHHCLLNGLFRHRSKKTSKLCVTGLCAGIHWWPVNSPRKWPVTWKIFPFHDVIMIAIVLSIQPCIPTLYELIVQRLTQYIWADMK